MRHLNDVVVRILCRGITLFVTTYKRYYVENKLFVSSLERYRTTTDVVYGNEQKGNWSSRTYGSTCSRTSAAPCSQVLNSIEINARKDL